MQTLKIKDRAFKITLATISEKIENNGKKRWNLKIETEGEKYNDIMWAPSITGENMLVSAPELESIVGKEVEIKEAYNQEGQEYMLIMYVFEHHDTRENKIKFLSKNGNKLLVDWTGKCDIFWNDEYGENVPFSVEAELEITEFNLVLPTTDYITNN